VCKIKLIVIVLLFTVVLSGCFPGVHKYEKGKKAGFFMGIWHGWIAPISLLVAIFVNSSQARVYEVNNTGLWYDIGFYLAVISGFGGLSIKRSRKK
jgi:hypothetical protein